MDLLFQIKSRLFDFFVDHYPRFIINRLWKRHMGYTVNWKSPRDINEKIEWLVCYGDTSKWTDLADKYKVICQKVSHRSGWTSMLRTINCTLEK